MRDAGGNRYQERPARRQMRCQPKSHGAHLLRFDGKHDHLGALHRARVVRRSLDGVVAHQPLQLVLAGVGYHEPLSRQAPLGQAADQRGGHVAAADECQLSYIVQESTPLDGVNGLA